MSFSPHFCKGRWRTAFVFSVPGQKEKGHAKPAAGDTGLNLDAALVHLNSAWPILFPSSWQYDYRITNAFSEPIAISLGHGKPEAGNKEIRTQINVGRIRREVKGCNLVILCGNKARLLSKVLQRRGRTVIEVSHVGNKGLNGTFKLDSQMNANPPSIRRQHRVRLWAEAVLQAIEDEGKNLF
jgi:hypothetical protein